MFCSNCGKKIEDDNTIFCSSCGQRIKSDDGISISETRSNNTQKESAVGEKKIKYLLITGTVFFLTIMGLVGLYFYEKQVNQKVVVSYHKVIGLMEEGKYSDAKETMDTILHTRPGFQIAIDTAEYLNIGVKLEKQLVSVDDLLKNNKLHEANKIVDEVRIAVKNDSSTYIKGLNWMINDKEQLIKVYTIKSEINSLDNIDQLVNKMSELRAIKKKEAEEVTELLKKRMDSVAEKTVQQEIEELNFFSALSVIDQAQKFSSSPLLVALKERVIKEKESYEKAEVKRMEEIVELQAKDDIKNQTNAIALLELNSYLDEYGDVIISGVVKNQGTRGVYSVTINYDAYDMNGNFLGSSDASIYPNYLYPGDEGYFEKVEYGIYQQIEIKTTNSTWYID